MFSRKLRMRLREREIRNIELSDEVLELYHDKAKLSVKIEDYSNASNQRNKEIVALKKELTELKEMVREQTHADLLLNALKAIGVIKEEEEVDRFQEARRLDNRLR